MDESWLHSFAPIPPAMVASPIMCASVCAGMPALTRSGPTMVRVADNVIRFDRIEIRPLS